MVSDRQYRRLLTLMQQGETLTKASLKTGMDVKTARRCLTARKLPTTLRRVHDWRTREDVFVEVWDELREKLGLMPGLDAKTLFADLQRRYPGRSSRRSASTTATSSTGWCASAGRREPAGAPCGHRPAYGGGEGMSAPQIKSRLVAHLKELHLPTMRASFEELADMARREALTFEHYLLELIEHEQEARPDGRVQRLLRESRLPFEKTLEAFDRSRMPRKLDLQLSAPRRRLLPRPPRERPGLRQSGFRQNACALRAGP